MDRKRLNPGFFGDLRHRDAIFVRPVPTGANLQGDRHLDSGNHGVKDFTHQVFVFQ
ncbi:hypothetical protein D3C85_1308750 [compost metagenome]